MRRGTITYYLQRLSYDMGRKALLGERRYRARGFVPSPVDIRSRHELHLLKPIARAMAMRDGVFVDVGVNTGQTLLKVLAIDPTREYLGFEPQVGCCFFVEQFLQDNQVFNARVLCLALSDTNRLLPIYAEGQYDEMASLVEVSRLRYADAVAPRYVPARIADEVFAEIGCVPAIVKIDVEGAELAVLRGMAKTLSRLRPTCFFEVLPNFAGVEKEPIEERSARRNRAQAAEITKLFANLNYDIRQIGFDGEEQPITDFDLDTPRAYLGSDYVAYPRAR